MELFGLIDCNNFFVSCERLFRPDLIGCPVVVLSSNDGVVVSRSQEAKAVGVPMGVPYFQVKELLAKEKAAVFSSNFELYRDISDRVMSTLFDELEKVYPYSIDEAFFRLKAENDESVLVKLSSVKAVVEKNVGVPVSLGAGKTMTIAKLASEREKRGSGVCILHDKVWKDLTPTISLSEVWGVGAATARSMKKAGLETIADLCAAPENRIKGLFGVHGLRLHSELSEIAAHDPEERSGLQKSIMSTRSFTKATKNLGVLEQAVTYHVERAAEELREIDGQCSSLRVILGTGRHSDWLLHGGSEETVLQIPTNDTRVLLKEALSLTRKMFNEDVPYKKAGVILGRISSSQIKQPQLFVDKDATQDDESLMKVLDGINDTLGKDTLTIGRVKGAGAKLTSSSFRSPCYTTNWNELKTVR